jgi:hypothetical protein
MSTYNPVMIQALHPTAGIRMANPTSGRFVEVVHVYLEEGTERVVMADHDGMVYSVPYDTYKSQVVALYTQHPESVLSTRHQRQQGRD